MSSDPAAPSGSAPRLSRTQVIIVGSIMFTFISYWRTAAVVLCDLASTAYYIGGIVEQAIGKAAPWFILAVMLFSYAVRNVYIESCSLFIRGGVYRVVRAALGSFAAKLAVSALIFDYILTGPISTVSAGQYVIGLLLALLQLANPEWVLAPAAAAAVKDYGSVIIACAVTLYFFRLNLYGIHESSDKAIKIMMATTVMAVIVLIWCGLTLALRPEPIQSIPLTPNLERKTEDEGHLQPKLDPVTQEQQDPLGLLGRILPESWQDSIRQPASWLSLVGLIGIMIAFGHSVLAMSGEETLAQVYREVESPKLPNFKKAAFIVFIYSIILTAGISFLAVLIIPDDIRMKVYSENLIGGLAMNVIGPQWARVALNGFVTIVGFMILSGACNTSIIGANGVLNRVAEDGILPEYLRQPHPRYGTTYRVLYVIVGLQLLTIIASRGNVYLLGEAYAFGVLWSFVFQAFSMVVLRFKDPRPREYKVPLNLRVAGVELPIGLILVFLVLLVTALLNLFTKEVATVGGLLFGGAFFTMFAISERIHQKNLHGAVHEHLERFNQETTADVSPETLGLRKPYRKLVAIRSPQNLFMLERTLAETDPLTTDLIVMTAKQVYQTVAEAKGDELDHYDQQLMTAVVNMAEKAGKQVRPLIVPTNNPLHAVLKTAQELHVQELVVGASNKFTADEQLEQVAFYWINLHHGQSTPVTIRILSRDRDVYLDLAGGNRIPRLSERQAKSVAELRAAGVGVDRVLFVYDGSPAGSDLFEAVLTMLDPQVALAMAPLVPPGNDPFNGHHLVHQDEERAARLGRQLTMLDIKANAGPELVRLAREGKYDLVILALPHQAPAGNQVPLEPWAEHILHHCHCRVFLASPPSIPREVVDQPPAEPSGT